MDRWGPIPRIVLEFPSQKKQVALWSELIRKSPENLEIVYSAVKGQEKVEKVFHSFLQECPSGQGIPLDEFREKNPYPTNVNGVDVFHPNCMLYYCKGEVKMASDLVEEVVVQKILRNDAMRLKAIANAGEGLASIASLRGRALEKVVKHVTDWGSPRIRYLPPARTFRCRLRYRPRTALRLGKQPVKRWSSLRELERLKGHKGLLLPTNKSQAGLDGFFWDEDAGHHVPFDCTVSSQHGIHMLRLRDALVAVGWDPVKGWATSASGTKPHLTIDYYWVVTEGIFASPAAFVTAQPAKKHTFHQDVASNLQQYVMSYDASLAEGVVLPGQAIISPPTREECER
jgi:hypothetical protein